MSGIYVFTELDPVGFVEQPHPHFGVVVRIYRVVVKDGIKYLVGKQDLVILAGIRSVYVRVISAFNSNVNVVL